MRYEASADRYFPISWDEAFAAIGGELKALDPSSVVFYVSGRASLANNLPDICGRPLGKRFLT